MPSFESAVNPLHQVRVVGPVILKVNHVDITGQILTNIFGLEVFADTNPSTMLTIMSKYRESERGAVRVAKYI